MDVQTIDHEYQQLGSQAQQTIGELKNLAGKLSGAANGGNQDAKEWLLDLKSIALAMQAEQNQVTLLLQALHQFVANQGHALAQPAPAQANPWGAPQPAPGMMPMPPQQQPAYGQSYGGYGGGASMGGVLGSFLNSGFGRALTMGAGFGIGDDLINKIF